MDDAVRQYIDVEIGAPDYESLARAKLPKQYADAPVSYIKALPRATTREPHASVRTVVTFEIPITKGSK